MPSLTMGGTRAISAMAIRRGRIPSVRSRGFTIVELVSVIVVTGILAAVAMPRFFEKKTFDASAFADTSKAMLHYAQKLAIAQNNRAVFVRLNGSSVALCYDVNCTAGNLVPAPSGANSGGAATRANCQVGGVVMSAWYCEGVPSGVAYALNPAAPLAAVTFYFDSQGMPFAAADPWLTPASNFAPLVIRVNGDGSNRDITVERETGYVY